MLTILFSLVANARDVHFAPESEHSETWSACRPANIAPAFRSQNYAKTESIPLGGSDPETLNLVRQL
jgi:hypothetical protein